VIAPVTEIEAGDDRYWFADHPNRRFRARVGSSGTWFIRRCGDVFLRSFARAPVPADTDIASAHAWFAAAYPQWPIERVQRRARKAVRKVRS
jgi:hypothetical protein